MAATALVVSGIGTPVYTEPVLGWALNGQFTGVDPVSGTPWNRVGVPWPAQSAPFVGLVSLGTSVAIGTDELHARLLATSGPKTVVGVSAGTLVVDEVMRRLATDPNAPSKDEVTFVVIADGSRKLEPTDDPLMRLLSTFSGYTYQAPPETPYDLTVVAGEFDGFADWPDKFNLIAYANALAGILVVHVPTYFADLTQVPAQNITVTTNSKGGVTTTYLVPTERLPLVTLFPVLGLIEPTLREWVDAGYSRNDAAASSATSVLATAVQRDALERTSEEPVRDTVSRLADADTDDAVTATKPDPTTPRADALADAPAQTPRESTQDTVSDTVKVDSGRSDTRTTNPDADDSTAAPKLDPATSTAKSNGDAPVRRSQVSTREAGPAEPSENGTSATSRPTGPAQSPSRQHTGPSDRTGHSVRRPHNRVDVSDDGAQSRTSARGGQSSSVKASNSGGAKTAGSSTAGKSRADRDSGAKAPKRDASAKRSE